MESLKRLFTRNRPADGPRPLVDTDAFEPANEAREKVERATKQFYSLWKKLMSEKRMVQAVNTIPPELSTYFHDESDIPLSDLVQEMLADLGTSPVTDFDGQGVVKTQSGSLHGSLYMGKGGVVSCHLRKYENDSQKANTLVMIDLNKQDQLESHEVFVRQSNGLRTSVKIHESNPSNIFYATVEKSGKHYYGPDSDMYSSVETTVVSDSIHFPPELPASWR